MRNSKEKNLKQIILTIYLENGNKAMVHMGKQMCNTGSQRVSISIKVPYIVGELH
jgi:hypothetical protein